MIKKYQILFLCFICYSCHKKDQLANLPPEPTDSVKKSHDKYLKPLMGENTIKTPNPVSTITAPPVGQPALKSATSEDVNINSLTAIVNGVETSQLSFRVSGYISAVLVKNGQYVKKGQVIAKLDNSIALQQLNLAKFALDQANVTQHYAELTLKRTQTLNKRQATTQIALEQAESAYQNSLIACKQADANLKLAQISYDDTNLMAPFDGYLFNFVAWIGNYISSTAIVGSLTSVNNLQIQIPVPQTVANNFSIGQEFSFSNSSQNMRGTLKITGVVPYVDAASKTYLLFATPVKVSGQLMAGELLIVDLK